MLDWEIATLGDPLADFAYSVNAWVEPGDAGVYGADPPTALPGFPSRSDLIDRYAAATGADLSDLAYYRAFNSFKTACILHGVYARYRRRPEEHRGRRRRLLFARIGLSLDAAEARVRGDRLTCDHSRHLPADADAAESTRCSNATVR